MALSSMGVAAWHLYGSMIGAASLLAIGGISQAGGRLGVVLSASFALSSFADSLPTPLCGLVLVAVFAPPGVGARLRPRFHLGNTAAAATFATCAAIGAWAWTRTRATISFYQLLPNWVPTSAIVLIGVTLAGAIVNSIFEEVLWRVFIFDALSQHMNVMAGVALQALGFGIIHVHALPAGPCGVVLTGAFGAMAGIMTCINRGNIASSVLAHMCADIVLLTYALGMV